MKTVVEKGEAYISPTVKMAVTLSVGRGRHCAGWCRARYWEQTKKYGLRPRCCMFFTMQGCHVALQTDKHEFALRHKYCVEANPIEKGFNYAKDYVRKHGDPRLEGKHMTIRMSREAREVSRSETHLVLVPVCPAGDTHFAATVVFDLIRLQVDPDAIEGLPDYAGQWLKENSFGAAVAAVWSQGRKTYGAQKDTFIIEER